MTDWSSDTIRLARIRKCSPAAVSRMLRVVRLSKNNSELCFKVADMRAQRRLR